MLYSRILKAVSTIPKSPMSNIGARRAATSKHIGEPWMVTETKRLVPTILIWGGTMTGILLWPIIFRVYIEEILK
ncbi:Cox26p Ecym_4297 [Eremothecium cymbalariae DBVPG|uniref:Uncharacterized protein n=1 Tax=Eremothecium cymbalariae (strain CBS 270.75 / DBVPG 7215 / KCTC 17166 / NRRL Y-17582) TaxID=931890 RepID=G8JTK7_ERECY|nr:hypothetical protein Ecym_4297 [Eremothecium cymbalariae DBVPG\